MPVLLPHRQVKEGLQGLVEKRESLWFLTYTTGQDVCAIFYALN